MIVDVTVSRFFTAGILAGVTIPQTWHEDATLAPKVGDKLTRAKPLFGGSPYVDTVVAIVPR